MKTKIHTYRFDLNNVADREPYHQLKTRLNAEIAIGTRGHWMNSIGDRKSDWLVDVEDGQEIELETEFLFSNQWNSTKARVFDWYKEYQLHNKLIKTGHWLEMTPEMVAIRRETLKCGYTGEQFPANCGKVFNESARALGSVYLKESDLSTLRLMPVADEDRKQRAPLTDAERAYLMPLYIKAQTEGAKTQAGEARAALRAKYLTDYAETIAKAEMERDGFIWLMDHGVPTENVIFYNHTKTFCVGWRSPLSVEAHAAMLAVLEDFPFTFEVKAEAAAHGQTTVGTCYFPTRGNAIRCYREQEGADAAAVVDRKLAAGEIHVGKPPTKPGDRLSIRDCRYHVTA